MSELTQARLKELLTYEQETGKFYWKVKKGPRNVGDKAGTVNQGGYIAVSLDMKIYLAHRLAWFYMHGEWPSGLIDHINHKRDDNRIENLRVVTNSQNLQNQKQRPGTVSGLRGVTWSKSDKKWHARIKVMYKTVFLGCFPTKELAYQTYLAAAKKFHTHNPLQSEGARNGQTGVV